MLYAEIINPRNETHFDGIGIFSIYNIAHISEADLKPIRRRPYVADLGIRY